MRILVTGGQGQIGWELQRCLPSLGEVVAVDLAECDLTQPAQVSNLIRRVEPDLIVNTAAHTAVDRAESEPALSHTLNADVPEQLATEARRLGAALIHYSTDYVYDGTKREPYVESDPVNPLSTYGRTKLAGEQAVAAAGIPHLILRTSWVYAARGGNFARTMLKLAAERDALAVIADQHGAPTGAELLADVTAHALRRTLAVPALAGTYHCVAAGETHWHGYATHVIEWARAQGVPIRVATDAVRPIPTSAYPTPAQRPLNSRLDTRKLRAAFDLVLPDWRSGVDRMLTEIHAR